MTPSAPPETDIAPRGWRRRYLAVLLGAVLVQTLARLVFHVPQIGETWRSIALHLAILIAYLAFVALVAGHVPARWRGIAAVSLLAAGHSVVTIFDVGQVLAQHYAGMPAPVWILASAPRFALSLLASLGIAPWMVFAVLVAVFALHLLLYAPVSRELGAIARAAMQGRGRWIAGAAIAVFLALCLLVPAREWRLELFHIGSASVFRMAPAELMASGDDPLKPALPPRALPAARPLIVIIVDAMRRDRMGVYEPALDTTPFLNGLQKEGKLHVFPSSFSTCTFSFCGIMSVLSSHSWDDFGRRPATIFDTLSRYGYRGYAILAGSHRDFGNVTKLYGRGVDVRDQHGSAALDDQFVLDTLQATRFDDPAHSVLYLHLMSTHASSVTQPRFLAPTGTTPAAMTDGADPAAVRTYDGRVREADDFLGRIFALLERKGLLRNALVVITADHGERLGERGLYFHGGPLDHAGIAIPLMVYDGTGAAYPRQGLVSQIDIAPTLLRGVGGDFGEGWTGHPLQDAMRAAAIPIGNSDTTGVIAEIGGVQYKYLCDRKTGRERIERLDRANAEGVPMPLTRAPALLGTLRREHTRVARPIDEPCRH